MEELSAQLIEDSNVSKEGQSELTKDALGDMRILPVPLENEDETEEPRDMLVSAITPRIKLNLSIHERGVAFTSTKNEEIILPANVHAVQYAIVFPKREDCLQKPKLDNEKRRVLIPGSMVLLILDADKVCFRKKSLNQICFQLPQHYSDPMDASVSISDDIPQASLEEQMRLHCVDRFEETILELLKNALQLNHFYRIYNPKYSNVSELKAYAFQSDDGGGNQSIMQGKMPYLKCYYGVNDGVIYPMEEGLLFYKPPFFVHRSRLHSIAVGRGGGSRYVDLEAVVDGEGDEKERLEFTNIDREEMQVLNTYIHDVLVKAMARDVAEEEEGEDEVEKDKHQDVGKEVRKADSGNEGPSRKRYRRAASLEASAAIKRKLHAKVSSDKTGKSREDEEDDDDDDDYEAEGKSEEDEGEESEDEDAESEDENQSDDATISEEED